MYHKEEFLQLPAHIRQKAVEGLRAELRPIEITWLKEFITTGGEKWFCRNRWHFGGGMCIRNLLRTTVGILDQELPSGNWDDYYLGVVEAVIFGVSEAGRAYDDWDQW